MVHVDLARELLVPVEELGVFFELSSQILLRVLALAAQKLKPCVVVFLLALLCVACLVVHYFPVP